MTETFFCPGHRRITAEDAEAAARVFAGREARREYGRRAYVRVLRLDNWTENGRSHTFEAFIGRDVAQNQCSGRNVWIHVDRITPD